MPPTVHTMYHVAPTGLEYKYPDTNENSIDFTHQNKGVLKLFEVFCSFRGSRVKLYHLISQSQCEIENQM